MTARDDYPTLAKIADRDPDTTAGSEIRFALDEIDRLRDIRDIAKLLEN